jgi:hypothetical protein
MKELKKIGGFKHMNSALNALNRSPIGLHQNNLTRAAGGGLNAQGARAGKGIKHTRVGPLIRKPGLEPVKNRLTGTVWGWTKTRSIWHLQGSAAPLPGNNAYLSHVRRQPLSLRAG